MSDKNVMIFAFSTLIGFAIYQVAAPTHFINKNGKNLSFVTVSIPSASIASVECLDCLGSTDNTCEMQVSECDESQTCQDWMACVEDCATLNGDQSCYDDCDVAHTDVHAECPSTKACMCSVCIGACVDMCQTDSVD